ncbi:MAG TPA: NB-ARC domain-containing protein, partial [Allocoleopsis sp.]
MTPEMALDLLNSLLKEQKLKDIQVLVFQYSWQGWTYPQIAKHTGYGTSHIRDTGYELWQHLTQLLDEPITKKNVRSVFGRWIRQHQSASESNIIPLRQPLHRPLHQHWGEAFDVAKFYGRQQELSLLKQWVTGDSSAKKHGDDATSQACGCRLLILLGMGGMGKTALATRLAEHLQHEFDYLIWQSLRNAPPIDQVLSHFNQFLSHQPVPQVPTNLNAQLTQLMQALRSSRCLLVLDNVDAVLRSSDSFSSSDRESIGSTSLSSTPTGQYRQGYEGYGELLQRVATERHTSCLVLTSRELPLTLNPLIGDAPFVQTLSLTGLSPSDVQTLCNAGNCYTETAQDWEQLTHYYAGNPLALKIVLALVQRLFNGNITEFLRQGVIAIGDINSLLSKQFYRLSYLEKQVMYELAIQREWVTLLTLRQELVS